MSQALAAHYAHDALLPRPHGGMGRGAVLALLAHGALVLALTSTVQWRTRPPEVFSAELWAAVPQAAAPLPAPAPPPVVAPPPAPAPVPAPAPAPQPAPPPPPAAPERDADIATEQARKLEAQRKQQEAAEAARAAKAAEAEKARAERAKAEADNKAKREAEAASKREADAKKAEERKRVEAERKAAADAKAKAAAEAKAEDERLARQREENLRRMMGQAGNTGTTTTGPTGTGGTGTAAESRAPSASYVGRLIALIKPNIVFTGQVVGNPSAEVEVRAAAGGSIISKRLVKSSGDKDWDEAVLRAIDRTPSLPRDDDGRVPPALILVFRPGG